MQKKKNLTVIDTPAGRVLIGGTQDNTYTEDAALIIDLGGNDTYFNHAGGSTRLDPFSVVIDLSRIGSVILRREILHRAQVCWAGDSWSISKAMTTTRPGTFPRAPEFWASGPWQLAG